MQVLTQTMQFGMLRATTRPPDAWGILPNAAPLA